MVVHEDIQTIPLIRGLGEISDRYDAILCDIWGVLHDGVQSSELASKALATFRRSGGVVILISNAPRPSEPIRRQLAKLGVSAAAFDGIVTSGDVTIGLIGQRLEEPVYHIGPERDFSLFDEAGRVFGRAPRIVQMAAASYAICTGLREDDHETPSDYEQELSDLAAYEMEMICANPDIVIHRGETSVYCAGALARRYEEIGGSVLYAGKPFAPIYDAALALAGSVRSGGVIKRRVLAIGDGMKTDVAGAEAMGLDCLFVTSGIHRAAVRVESDSGLPDLSRLLQLCADHALRPTAAIGALRP